MSSHTGFRVARTAVSTSLPGYTGEMTTEAASPKTFSLSTNAPNPFNATTIIRYALPNDCYVRLKIYNIAGSEVATLVDGNQEAGYKTIRWDAGSLSSGVYFYTLRAGDFVETKKMILLR